MMPERLTAADLDALMILDRAAQSDHPWSAAHFEDALRRDETQVWGMREEDELLGFAVLTLLPFDAEIEAISVAQTQRRRGVGRRLLAWCIEQAQKAGRERLLLEVRASNAAAMALYRQMGFETDGRRRGYYPLADGQREDALLMSLRLEPV